MKPLAHSFVISATFAVLGGAALFLSSCSTPNATSTAEAPAPANKTLADNLSATSNGVQLWAQNCGHCHNVRSPGSYSDAQWDVAMLHMRVRANLTAEEHRKILEFLKSAN